MGNMVNISDSEWKIMKVLWEKPDLTLRQIFEGLQDSDWSYTTVRTMVSRLVEKKAIGADRSMINNFKYYPLVSENECRSKEIKSLLERAFDGSAKMMVSSLAKETTLSDKERRELIDIIENM